MRFPRPLSVGAGIGVTAPSSGLSGPVHLARLELALSHLRARGFTVVEGRCLRTSHKHVSAPAVERVRDLEALWANPALRAIIPPWGGELLIDLLGQLDFERLAASSDPKWLLGYSDTSTLLFAITVVTDIATAHGTALMDLIDGQSDSLTQACLSHLQTAPGESFEQRSAERYQKAWTPWSEQVDAPFALTEPSQWKSLRGRASERFAGRVIGGCLDTLVHLAGTPYGKLPEWIARHRDPGVVLFLENCELTPVAVARSLWQMRYADWFRDLGGLVFGRSSGPEASEERALSQREAIESVVGDLDIPVLLCADIGHVPPQMLLINGARASFELEHGRAKVVQQLA
jgi:muramoyltetrapeptide carboxypeptidase LdcA involved in peptidoglycan recycling